MTTTTIIITTTTIIKIKTKQTYTISSLPLEITPSRIKYIHSL